VTESATKSLRDSEVAKDFYEDRYVQGYMEHWPQAKRLRVAALIAGLNVPPHGEALDFGCGNGVFTAVLKQSLPPGWRVCGSDISAEAVKNAKNRVPGCEFFVAGDPALNKQFDLVFTHHVLEHVYDLKKTGGDIAGCVKPGGAMFHILPCGNEGSYEQRICAARTDGIDPQVENRFFYEDEGHVRRLTTRDIEALFDSEGLRLKQGWYSGQDAGAVDWITRIGPGFVLKLTDPSRAKDDASRARLKRERRRLLTLCVLRWPASLFETRLERRSFRPKDVAILIVGGLLYIFSKPFDYWLASRAAAEWTARRGDPMGSEMYLHFVRA
jgi:SAM-dependent methyltransferase